MVVIVSVVDGEIDGTDEDVTISDGTVLGILDGDVDDVGDGRWNG